MNINSDSATWMDRHLAFQLKWLDSGQRIINLFFPSRTSCINQTLDCSPNRSLKNAFAVQSSRIMDHPVKPMTDASQTDPDNEVLIPAREQKDDDGSSEESDDEETYETIPPIPEEFC